MEKDEIKQENSVYIGNHAAETYTGGLCDVLVIGDKTPSPIHDKQVIIGDELWGKEISTELRGFIIENPDMIRKLILLISFTGR